MADCVRCVQEATGGWVDQVAGSAAVFVQVARQSALIQALQRASNFCDASCLAAMVVLLNRAGYLQNHSMTRGLQAPPPVCEYIVDEHTVPERAVAVAFMLALKMDEEALDRCIEKALWSTPAPCPACLPACLCDEA